MKTIHTLLLAVSLLGSTILPLSFAETTSPAPAAHQQDFITWVKATMELMDDISSILATVNDKPTAETAAPLLPDKLAKLAAMYATEGILTEPSSRDNPELEALEAAHEAAEKRMFDAAASIAEADGYGSDAMRQIISLF